MILAEVSVLAGAASIIGAISGVVSLAWLLFQWGKGVVKPPERDDTLRGSIVAMVDSQKQITDQIFQITQAVRDMATLMRTSDQMANMRHEILARELSSVRQSLDTIQSRQ